MSKLHTFLDSQDFHELVEAHACASSGTPREATFRALQLAIAAHADPQYVVNLAWSAADAEASVKKAIQGLQERVMVPEWPPGQGALATFVLRHEPGNTVNDPDAVTWRADLQAVLDEVRGIKA